MKHPEEVSAELKKKSVTFDVDSEIKERTPKPMVPLHQATKARINHHRMKNAVFQYLFDEKFDELDLCFKPYSLKEIADFYKDKGRSIFSAAILSLKAGPLEYLLKTVPHEVTCELLTRNNFSILDGFIGGQRIEEEGGEANHESKAIFAEKLKMIFQLGNEQINNYIITNSNYEYMVGRGLKLTHG